MYNWLVCHVTVIFCIFHIFFSFLTYYINEMVGIKSRDPQNTRLVLKVLIIEVKSNENLCYNDLKMGVESTTSMLYVLQNSFNPASSNPGIVIIWQLSKVVPRREVLLFAVKHVVSGLTLCLLLLQLLQL